MHEPIFFAVFGAAKHLDRNAVFLRQADPDVSPDIADLPFQNLRGNFQLLFGELDSAASTVL
ncbi:MAG TPA: hypothetical protein VGK77_16400 [Candidatus Binatia bacterium]